MIEQFVLFNVVVKCFYRESEPMLSIESSTVYFTRFL